MAMFKALVVLPSKSDRHEGSLISDGKEYEINYLELSEEAMKTVLSEDYVSL